MARARRGPRHGRSNDERLPGVSLRASWLDAAGSTLLLFAFVVAIHSWLLRLPYFWDEAGYFIPAARDLFRTGSVIPQSTLNNIHPPLVSAWLALWWLIAGYHEIATRLAMALLAAFALSGVYRLARGQATRSVAIAAVLLTAVYPVFFAQSTMANLDLAAAAFTLWGIERHLAGRLWPSAAFFSLAVLAKETAILAPAAIFAWEACCLLVRRKWPVLDRVLLPGRRWRDLAIVAFPVVPLLAWIGYHYARTGWLLGNPEFAQYNLTATLSATRFALALAQRLWHLLGHMGMLVLTVAAASAMIFAPVEDASGPRPRISPASQAVMIAVIAAYWIALSLAGGALLPRYLLPVYPLVILLFVSTLRRRIREWAYLAVLIAGLFVATWFWRPPYHYSPEDNLAYADFVRLHQDATRFLKLKYPHATVLTAWPASDELTRSWLGYLAQPLRVVRIENFTLDNVAAAQHSTAPFDVIFAFSTKYEPARPLVFGRFWRGAQEKYFGYHRDLPPEAIAQMFGGTVVWTEHRAGLWAAVIDVPQSHYAKDFRLQITDLAASGLCH